MSADFTSVRDVNPSPSDPVDPDNLTGASGMTPAGDSASPAAPARRLTAWSVALPLVALGAGFLVVSGVSTARGTDLRAERRTNLTDLVSAREETVGARADQVAQIQTEVDSLVAGKAALGAPTENPAVAAGAGTSPVSGAGLTVTLDDAPRSVRDSIPDGVTPDDLVVHQQDVQAVVNAMWSAGAQGMTIMDQRVISTSAVRCVGNTLVLQGRVYGPPFRISAVGDARAMRSALDSSAQVSALRTWVDAVGLGYDVVDERTLTLPAYAGSLDLSYARSTS